MTTRRQVTRHREVAIEYGELRADVDEPLAPIVLRLWQLGIPTTGSCQGPWQDQSHGYIQFETADGATRFLALIAAASERGRHSLSQRVLGGMYADPDVIGEDELWDFACWPVPVGRPYDRAGLASFTLAVEVHFPPTDIPLIARRVGRARPRAGALGS
jgi:hypothetical protein